MEESATFGASVLSTRGFAKATIGRVWRPMPHQFCTESQLASPIGTVTMLLSAIRGRLKRTRLHYLIPLNVEDCGLEVMHSLSLNPACKKSSGRTGCARRQWFR